MRNCTRRQGQSSAVNCAHATVSHLLCGRHVRFLPGGPGAMAMGRQRRPQGLQRPAAAAATFRPRTSSSSRGKTAVTAPTAPAAAAPAAARPRPRWPPRQRRRRLSKDDKELLAKKKKAESEAAARAKEEADSQARIKATNCENAKANQALLDSGVRMRSHQCQGRTRVSRRRRPCHRAAAHPRGHGRELQVDLAQGRRRRGRMLEPKRACRRPEALNTRPWRPACAAQTDLPTAPPGLRTGPAAPPWGRPASGRYTSTRSSSCTCCCGRALRPQTPSATALPASSGNCRAKPLARKASATVAPSGSCTANSCTTRARGE